MVFLWRVNDNQFILAGPISSDTFARRTKNLLEGVHVAYFQNGNVYESPENSGLGCQIGNLSFATRHILKRASRIRNPET